MPDDAAKTAQRRAPRRRLGVVGQRVEISLDGERRAQPRDQPALGEREFCSLLSALCSSAAHVRAAARVRRRAPRASSRLRSSSSTILPSAVDDGRAQRVADLVGIRRLAPDERQQQARWQSDRSRRDRRWRTSTRPGRRRASSRAASAPRACRSSDRSSPTTRRPCPARPFSLISPCASANCRSIAGQNVGIGHFV